MSAHIHVESVTEVSGLVPMTKHGPLRIEVVRATSDLFGVPVIATSDLHKDAINVLAKVHEVVGGETYHLVSCGDMAGTTRYGQDADPAELLEFAAGLFVSYHFVLGNHDDTRGGMPKLENADATPCQLDGEPRGLGNRTLGGVSGIVGNPRKIHRVEEQDFSARVQGARADGADVLVTHETPLVPGFLPAQGRQMLCDAVVESAFQVHFFGHCHLSPMVVEHEGVLFVCVEARVLVIDPV